MPRPHFVRFDPMAWRLAVFIILITGLAAAGNLAPERLARGLVPTNHLKPPPRSVV